MFSIRDITKANLADIPEPCRSCVYWEFPDDFDKAKQDKIESRRGLEFEEKKRGWFVKTMKKFGTCGKIAYCDSRPVAYAQFAPSELLPNTIHYESQPVGRLGEGVVFLSCLYVAKGELRGKGLGKTLLENIIKDLRGRGFKAIETYARKGSSDNPSGPLEFYIKEGFAVKDQTNPEFPLVRISL
jgi:GNAT superfamily N-acetyltransferase